MTPAAIAAPSAARYVDNVDERSRQCIDGLEAQGAPPDDHGRRLHHAREVDDPQRNKNVARHHPEHHPGQHRHFFRASRFTIDAAAAAVAVAAGELGAKVFHGGECGEGVELVQSLRMSSCRVRCVRLML
jgi:hypothetical protein